MQPCCWKTQRWWPYVGQWKMPLSTSGFWETSTQWSFGLPSLKLTSQNGADGRFCPESMCIFGRRKRKHVIVCVWAFPSLFHVLCLTPGFCASRVFVDEAVSRGWGWLTDRLSNHSVQEGEIDYLAAGFRGHGWPISNSLINRIKSLREKHVCMCVSAIMCTLAFFMNVCVCEGFSTKQRKPVWAVWGDALWTRCWVICCTSSSAMITATQWYFHNTYFFSETHSNALSKRLTHLCQHLFPCSRSLGSRWSRYFLTLNGWWFYWLRGFTLLVPICWCRQFERPQLSRLWCY